MEYTTLAALAAAEGDTALLGTVAGASYYELRLIVRVQDGQTSIAGRGSDWPVIRRDAEIAELRRQLEAARAQAAELTARLDATPAPPVPHAEGRPCPWCDKPFADGRALGGHKAHCTKRPPPAAPPPTRPTLVPIVPIEPPFRCAICGGDAHARSVADPAICIRCHDAARETAPLGNGQQRAA